MAVREQNPRTCGDPRGQTGTTPSQKSTAAAPEGWITVVLEAPETGPPVTSASFAWDHVMPQHHGQRGETASRIRSPSQVAGAACDARCAGPEDQETPKIAGESATRGCRPHQASHPRGGKQDSRLGTTAAPRATGPGPRQAGTGRARWRVPDGRSSTRSPRRDQANGDRPPPPPRRARPEIARRRKEQ